MVALVEDHQELEKPMFQFRHTKLRSSRILRNCTTMKMKKNRLSRESMNQYEEIFCYYGTQKSALDHQRSKKKKRLIRCGECGKGFRYEKCLLNHRKLMHCEEESKMMMRSSLLCSFSGVQRRKRSKRVSRYKSFSVSSSSSFRMFPVSVDDGELLEVAESLILLSKSSGRFLNGLKFVGESPLGLNQEVNMRECEDGFLSNEKRLGGEALHSSSEMNVSKSGEFGDGFLSREQKFVGISSGFDGISKGFLGYLGDKKAVKDDESGRWKLVGGGSCRAVAEMERLSLEDRPRMMLEYADTSTEQKLGCQETAFGDSNSGSKGSPMNIEHRCRICDKVFPTYQALGGHQTHHRIRHKSAKSNQEMQRRMSRRS